MTTTNFTFIKINETNIHNIQTNIYNTHKQ